MVETLIPDFPSGGFGEPEQLPFIPDIAFTDHKGVYRPRIEKRQRKLARQLSFLQDFLEEDEKLLIVTAAVSPASLLEQLTTGWILVYIKRCLLVLTNKRIIHVPTTMNYGYRHSIAQVRYGDLESIAQKGRRLKLRYKSGAKEQFLYVRRSERKKIRSLLPTLDLQGIPSNAGGRVHLCPRCHAEQEPKVFECPACSLPFKNRRKAVALSIWLPGGGYFYTGHPVLGISDALVEAFLILVLVLSLIPTPEFPEPAMADALFIGVILVIEKLITIYHAYHFVSEYLPRDKAPKPAEAFASA